MYFILWMGISCLLLWNKPPQNSAAFKSQLHSCFWSNWVWPISNEVFHARVVRWKVSWWLFWSRVASFTFWRLATISQCASVLHVTSHLPAACLNIKYSKRKTPICKHFSNVCLFHMLLIGSHIVNWNSQSRETHSCFLPHHIIRA